MSAKSPHLTGAFWLLKTEPGTYSFDQLVSDRRTNWNGVRNFQARNYMMTMKTGDFALIYHSGEERAVVGISKVIQPAYPDPDPKKKGDWVQVDLAPVEKLKRAVSLAQIKADSRLKALPLIRQSRLSVMPIEKRHYELLRELGSF